MLSCGRANAVLKCAFSARGERAAGKQRSPRATGAQACTGARRLICNIHKVRRFNSDTLFVPG